MSSKSRDWKDVAQEVSSEPVRAPAPSGREVPDDPEMAEVIAAARIKLVRGDAVKSVPIKEVAALRAEGWVLAAQGEQT